MKANRVLLFCFVRGCLLLAISAPLSAQQPGPPAGQRVTPPPPAKKITLPSVESPERRCREFLPSVEELRSRFQTAQEDDLTSALERAKKCVESSNIRVRHAAFDAYVLLRDEKENRGLQHVIDIWVKTVDDNSKATASMIESDAEQEQKLRADFAETANFAVTLYKQREQYREELLSEYRAYDKLKELYRETYELAVEAINLAGNRSRGVSLPAFVNEPAPQVIRIETPEVPRSLHCTANTMPSAAPGLSTWTWTDCHW